MLYSPFLNELQSKDEFEGAFLVKYLALQNDKNGRSYLNLILMDKSGEMEARVWDEAEDVHRSVKAHEIVRVSGKVNVYQGKKQLILHVVESAAQDSYPIDRFLPASAYSLDRMYEDLLSIVATLENDYAKKLCHSILEDEKLKLKIQQAPAAKSWHHAYIGGLLEHILSICRIMQFLGKHYKAYYGNAIDSDLLILGAIFHDIGKIHEFDWLKGTEYTDAGKLLGHLVQGCELIDAHIRKIDGFPEDYALKIKHQILAHHGKLEYGSPKLPQTLEALIVHYIDDLDSKVNSILGILKKDTNPGDWTAFDKSYERLWLKPKVMPEFQGESPGV